VKPEPEKAAPGSFNLSDFQKNSRLIFFVLPLLLFVATGCENDMKKIRSLDLSDSLRFEFARDIKIYYSDSGMIRAILSGPVMKTYEIDDGYQEFPQGFELIFFDSIANPQSIITANYGVNYEKKNRMEAKHHVVVKNLDKNEQLDTEHLVWDRKNEVIFSEVFVKITKPNEVIFGDGLTSDQNFDFYEIKNPSGEFMIYPDDDD
jgi:LPS export ABC transporter protein LptC